MQVALLLPAEKHELGMAMKCSLMKQFTLNLLSLHSVYTLINDSPFLCAGAGQSTRSGESAQSKYIYSEGLSK